MAGNDANTLLLLHCDGADTSTTIPDTSVGGDHGNATVVGTAQLSTVQEKFGSSSALLDGDSDYLTIPDSADWDFGTGDFCIEGWYRWVALPGGGSYSALWDNGGHTSGVRAMYSPYYSGVEVLIIGNAHTFAWAPSVDTWYHIAIVRYGDDTKMYINGTATGDTWTGTDNYNITGLAAGFWIGNGTATGYYYNGHIDEFRISNIARWTSNFTAPTAAYSAAAANPTSQTIFIM